MDSSAILQKFAAPPFVITQEEQAELTALAARIEKLKQKRLILIRRYARKRKLIASQLGGLRQKDSPPFVEVSTHKPYKVAVGHSRNEAYACPHGCGWVKGEPDERRYDDIAPLSGSAGKEYSCRICGAYLGRMALVMS